MVLSLATGWTSTMMSGSPIWSVEIDLDGGSTVFRFVSGSMPLYSDETGGPYPNSVMAVQPVSTDMDPLERTFAVGSTDIIFLDDGALRSIQTANRLFSKTVTLKLGEQSMAWSSLATVATLVIEDIIPAENGTIIMRCSGWNVANNNTATVGTIRNGHPLEIISDMLAQTAGIPATYFDFSTLDPELAAYDEIAHFNISILDSGASLSSYLFDGMSNQISVADKKPIRESVAEILQILYATIRPDENGVNKLHLYDETAASVRTLTADDIDSFEQLSTYEDLRNVFDLTLGFLRDGQTSDTFRLEDSTSVSTYALPGESERVVSETFSSKFYSGHGFLTNPDNGGISGALADNAVWFEVQWAAFTGFAGNRWDTGSGVNATVPAWAQCDDDHLVYLLLTGEDAKVVDGLNVNPSGYEIISCNAVSVAADTVGRIAFPTTVRSHNSKVLPVVRFDIKERGLFGTTVPGDTNSDKIAETAGSAWAPLSSAGVKGTQVFDVTMAVRLFQILLKRFSNGCPRAKFGTSLRHFDLEIGDFVSIPGADKYLNYAKNGADTNVIWELTSKEVDVDSGTISWKVAWVRDDIAPVTVTTFRPPDVMVSAISTQITPQARTEPIITLAGNFLRSADGSIIEIRLGGSSG